MHRQILLQQLERYRLVRPGYDFDDGPRLQGLVDFIKATPECFERHPPGHLTASAVVLDPTLSHLVLTHHAKLDMWIQLGGHCDGDPDTEAVARREAAEEAGLHHLELVEPVPFDVDVLPVPARPEAAFHWHYDLRYLFVSPRVELVPTDESKDLRWFTLGEAARVAVEPTMQRLLGKLTSL
ncbi:MAG: NUDIX hydrolase [Candidatus Eremiobacteraeota bacterium]|nr:NUDIX hydrolase [Candidatus Eremiobacteraeota bacterium]